MPHAAVDPRAATLFLAVALAGCGGTVTQTATPTPPTPTGVAISGTAFVGTKPLAASTVQLFAAGTSGDGSAPTALSSSATTAAAGTFTVPAGYTCPAPSSQLFLTARGGSAAAAPANNAVALIVPLGRCDQVAASTSFVLNEVTTAATAWALSQFLSPGGNIGASATNAVGLANAVATALSLAGNTSGTSPGPTFPSTGTSPAPRINALANLLNACTSAIPSTGVTSPAQCVQLLTLSAFPSQTPLSNTLDAALAIVRNPASQVLPLFRLSQTATAFTPTLTAAPADWTLPLTFSGGGMHAPGPLALDAIGNLWVASYFSVASQFSPIGAPTFPSGITGLGLSESYGLAIDPSNNVWIANETSPPAINSAVGSVTVLTPAGQPLSGQTGFSSGGLNYPIALAINPNGTTWVVDYGNSHITQLSATGQPLSGTSGYFSNLFAFPVAIALDAAGNAWVANMSGTGITRVSSDGKQFTNFPCCDTAAGLALDLAGNVWVSNYLDNTVSQVSPTGPAPTAFAAPSINHPQGIAIDGAGHVWIASFRGTALTELAGATAAIPGTLLSPSAGWAPTPTSLQTFAIAIDASGNVWTSNFANDTITKLVGLATPVKTPLFALPQLP